MSIDVPQFRRHTNRTGLGADLGKRIVHLREIVQQEPPSSRRTRTRTRTTTTTTITTTMTTRPDSASMVPHRPSGCAAKRHPVRPRPARPPPLRYVPGRRQPVGIRAASTQVRPGRSRRARRWSAIGQRRRPATVPPRRRDAKKEYFVLNISFVLLLTIQLVVVVLPRMQRHRPAAVARRHGPAAVRTIRRCTQKGYW